MYKRIDKCMYICYNKDNQLNKKSEVIFMIRVVKTSIGDFGSFKDLLIEMRINKIDTVVLLELILLGNESSLIFNGTYTISEIDFIVNDDNILISTGLEVF